MMCICPLFVADASNLSITGGEFMVFLVSRSVSVNICHVVVYIYPSHAHCEFIYMLLWLCCSRYMLCLC